MGTEFMPFTSGIESPTVAVGSGLWIWAAATLLLTAALGFTAGYWYARLSAKWALERAGKHMASLYRLVLQRLEAACDACAVLEEYPGLLLSPEQIAELESRRSGLVESMSRIAESQRVPESLGDYDDPPETALEWTQSPQDERTGLPDQDAFETNLETLLQWGAESRIASGLLLVRIDKFPQLSQRFGPEGAEQLLKKAASVLCRSIRDADLVCRYDRDTFGVLIPAVGRAAGRKLAESLRDAIRSHHFRLDSNGAEVLVTASFGYTACLPQDSRELVLDRAGNALDRSRRRGRNQLHLHDGESLVRCPAS